MSRLKNESREDYNARMRKVRAKAQMKKVEEEYKRGYELYDRRVRISESLWKKMKEGRTQILITPEGKVVQFHKNAYGYWINSTWKGKNKICFLHRERMRESLGWTDEQMKDYDVHHIDKNVDNNSISNLQLLSREEHNVIHHGSRNKTSRRHICKNCSREYSSKVSTSVDYCDRCYGGRYATENSRTIKKVCDWCGGEYEITGSNQRFCSNRCKSAEWRHSRI